MKSKSTNAMKCLTKNAVVKRECLFTGEKIAALFFDGVLTFKNKLEFVETLHI